MDALPLLRSLREISGQLAAKAREGDWDALPELQSRADGIVDELRMRGGVAADSPSSAEAAALIRAALDDFSAARESVAPWLEQVKPLLDAFSATQP